MKLLQSKHVIPAISFIIAGCTILVLSGILSPVRAADAEKPNIVLIYTDDLGYGDVSCNGATKVQTPNIDRLAAEGLNFTDAHCAAATCTPSRYAMLTGEYAWRMKGTGILPGDAKMAIAPGRTTIPSMLKNAGYTTGVVGKWHLGLGDGSKPIDWNAEVKPGPREIGFDYSFLVPATGDRVPCVYLENYRVVDLDPSDPIQVSYGKKIGDDPTGREHPELLKMKFSHGHDCTIVNGISRIGYMSGGNSARWVDEDMADVLSHKAVTFIDENREKPFFLYFSTHDIHVPRVPNSRFVGKSGCGTRGDAIVQLDWCVGQVLDKLDELGLKDNTLVIFSSDNGPVYDDGYEDGAVEDRNGHDAAGPLRGGKYSRFEGGTRVPMLVRWPGKVEPKTTSDALFSQVDLLASLASLVDEKLDEEAGPDSFDTLDVLLGKSDSGREYLVEQGNGLSLRMGEWKYMPETKGAKINKNTATELGPEGSLFNLKDDIGEKENLIDQQPEIAKKMDGVLKKIQEDGRSR